MLPTDVGKGPLELLELRGFALPSRAFVKRETPVNNARTTDGPPPLPKAAIEAARKAEIALPGGRGALWRSVEITHRASGSSSRRR